MTRHVIVLVLIISATAVGAWARQVNGGVDEVKSIEVIASRFKFEPAIISVVEGDKVRLRVRSVDRTHGIGIKAFRVKALIPKAGEAVTVEFVADRAGTFDITCSEYCGTGHRAMKGRLIVLAREKWSRALAVESYIPSWGGCDFTDLAPNEAEVRNGSSVDVPNTPKRTQWLRSSSTGKRFGRAHFAARSKRVAGAGGMHGAVTLCRLRGL